MSPDAMTKADILVEAMSWIAQFRDKTTVVKIGGSLLDDEEALTHLLLDVCFMSVVGMRPVVVHGAGGRINRAMEEAGLEPRFVQGRRYTDEKALKIVEKVLAGDVNWYLAEQIRKLGGNPQTLNFQSEVVLSGEVLKVNHEGEQIDLGFVGQVNGVDKKAIGELSDRGQIPVIPSMCFGDDGQKLNVNADSAAMAIAEALGAEKLVFVSDIPGVMTDPSDPSSLIPSLTPSRVEQLVQQNVIQGGMIPKTEACVSVLDRGVSKVHIVDGRVRHALLMEIYTSDGVGTQFVKDPE